MKLLIDTCNVLHRTGVLPPDMAGIDEESLATLIRGSRYRNYKSIMVCDGNARNLSGGLRGHSKGLVQFKFSGQAQSADTLILGLVERSNSPKRLIVVSSDREIQVVARRRCQPWQRFAQREEQHRPRKRMTLRLCLHLPVRGDPATSVRHTTHLLSMP